MLGIKTYLHTNFGKIVRYLIAGGLNTLFGLALSNFLFYIIGLDTRTVITITFIITVSSLFFLSRRFTFDSKGKSNKQLAMFSALMIINYIISLWFIPFLQNYGLTFFFAQLLFLCIFTVVNFLIKNHFIFRKI